MHDSLKTVLLVLEEFSCQNTKTRKTTEDGSDGGKGTKVPLTSWFSFFCTEAVKISKRLKKRKTTRVGKKAARICNPSAPDNIGNTQDHR